MQRGTYLPHCTTSNRTNFRHRFVTFVTLSKKKKKKKKEIIFEEDFTATDIAYRVPPTVGLLERGEGSRETERHRKLTVIAFNVTRARTDQSQLFEVTESRGRRRNQLLSGFVAVRERLYSRHRENSNERRMFDAIIIAYPFCSIPLVESRVSFRRDR